MAQCTDIGGGGKVWLLLSFLLLLVGGGVAAVPFAVAVVARVFGRNLWGCRM